MAFDWQAIKETVESGVIELLGTTCTISREDRRTRTPTATSPATSIANPRGENAKSAVFNCVLTSRSGQFDDGRMTTNKKNMLIVSPGEFEPKSGDKVKLEGENMKIMRVIPIRPNGVDTIIYECELRI